MDMTNILYSEGSSSSIISLDEKGQNSCPPSLSLSLGIEAEPFPPIPAIRPFYSSNRRSRRELLFQATHAKRKRTCRSNDDYRTGMDPKNGYPYPYAYPAQGMYYPSSSSSSPFLPFRVHVIARLHACMQDITRAPPWWRRRSTLLRRRNGPPASWKAGK